MVNFKLNPNCPMQYYRAVNVVTEQGTDWKELPHPVHARVIQDINRNVLILDGDNPYSGENIPVLDSSKFDLPEKTEEVVLDEVEEDNGILGGRVGEVKEKISYISDKELLKHLLEEEKMAKNRKSVINSIQEKL